jgi:hypothetical protein
MASLVETRPGGTQALAHGRPPARWAPWSRAALPDADAEPVHQGGRDASRPHARATPGPPAYRHGRGLDGTAAERRAQRPQLRRALRPARRRRVANPGEQAPHARTSRGEVQAPPRVHRGDRLPSPPRARQGPDPPARHLPLARGAPAGPDQRSDWRGQDLHRLRPRHPGLSQGLPGSVLAGLPASTMPARWRAPMAPTSGCSPSSPAWTCWSWTIGP